MQIRSVSGLFFAKTHPYARVYALFTLAFACAFVKTQFGLFLLALTAAAVAIASKISPKAWLFGLLAAFGLAANIFVLSVLSGMKIREAGFSESFFFVERCFCAYLYLAALASCANPDDIVGALSYIRMPVLVTALAGFSIRWQNELAKQIQSVNTARILRGGGNKLRISRLRDAAAISVAMLVRAFFRSERIAAAMECRGFQGRLPRPLLRRFALFDALPVLAAASLLTVALFAK